MNTKGLNIWEEKNLIEQEKNLPNKIEQNQTDIMKETKKQSVKKECNDIIQKRKLLKRKYDKLYHLKNREKRIKYHKQWYIENKEKCSVDNKKWRSKNIDKERIYNQKRKETKKLYNIEYSKKNRNHINLRRKILRKTNVMYKLRDVLRSRLNRALKNNQKVGSAVRDLGCTIPELKQYLESKFQDGMTWENHGYWGWHIDHIKPLISFDLTDRQQLLEACHYTNLQPLWAKDNLNKRDSL